MAGRSYLASLAAMLALACPRAPDEQPDAGDELDAASESESDDADALPAAPRLLAPEDGALEVPLVSELCWAAADEPEGEPLGYRVWVDEVELVDGKTGEYGFDSTCTGPLDFVPETSFTWRVRAYELDDPSRESPDSETWTFTSADDPLQDLVFFDDFSRELGWTFGGDATSGQWVRGRPVAVHEADDALAQPDGCALGQHCLYTGENPRALLGEHDVDGGSVVARSPAFDPSGYVGLSISLDRFFHRTSLEPTGHTLELALIVPDADAPSGETVHVLERLDGGATATPANAWTKVAFAACGIPMVAGTRLRATAHDSSLPDSMIVEAAIDEVAIYGLDDASACTPGPGALCDPSNPAAACGDELLCCPVGTIYSGVHRCAWPAAAIGDEPPANPGEPFTGPLGCDAPDLEVRDDNLHISVDNLFVPPDACSVYEGCVTGTGWRRVLRFDGKTANVGSRDLVLGIPANHPDLFTFSPCHEHHHFDQFARYTLLDGEQVIAAGHKQAFCLLDLQSWAWPELGDADETYTCFNQGLSVGWLDIYDRNLDCQWIDVTGVPYGDYTLRIEINVAAQGAAHPMLVERDYGNNVVEIPVVVDGN